MENKFTNTKAKKRKSLTPMEIQYAIRYKRLKIGGFKTYEDYLQSKIWEETRDYVYSTRKRECVLCFSTESLNLHHVQYLWIIYPDLKRRARDIKILCNSCHLKVHGVAKSQKVGFGKSLKLLIQERDNK